MPSPQTLSPGVRHLDLIQGSEVLFRAAVDRPLQEAWIEVKPSDVTVRIASLTGLLGAPSGLPQLSPIGFQATFPWFVQVDLDESRTQLKARFRPWLAGSYTLHLVDDNGLPRDYESDARVLVDPLPKAQLQRPTSNGSYVPTAEIPFRMLAEDEVFGLKSVYLEIRAKNKDGTLKDEAPSRLAVYEPRRLGDVLRAATGTLVPFEAILPPQPQRLELAMVWQLKKRFKVGDILSVQLCADDYCDLFTPRLPGRSPAIEMTIVGEEELAQQFENKFAEVQKDIKNIQKVEEDAKKLLDKMPKDAKADAKLLDQLIEAGQQMRAAQERIGLKNDEGVRDKLDKMQQSMRDNKVQNPEMQDQVRAMAQELERLAQQEFPKVEQQINEARKQAAGAEKQKTESKSPLEKAKETSEEIDKTLRELSRSLNKWADSAQIKGAIRETIEQQKEIVDATENLNNLAVELMKAGTEDKKVAKATEMERKKLAADQNAIEKNVKDLIEQIGDLKKRQDEIARDPNIEEGDKDGKARQDEAADLSKKLAAVKSKANNEKLNQDMQQAAKSLEGNKTNESLEKQKNALKTAKQMLDLMEGKKTDDLLRLRKKEKDVAKVQDDIERLQKRNDDRLDKKNPQNAKANAEKRADQMDDDAGELDKLARQLQRLQEPKAAREAEKAADELRKGAKKLRGGEPADEEERKAQEHLDKMEADLEDLQQELAREQLAQIGERIKGLKERQDAAVERSKELHAKVIARKQWSVGLIETLDADRQTQAGLAKETQSLEEKLKGALVFEHILKKAGKAMEEAAESMASRKELALEHEVKDFAKEELDDETKAQDKTLGQQKLAADRLDRLLEAAEERAAEAASAAAGAGQEGRQGQEESGRRRSGGRAAVAGWGAADGPDQGAQGGAGRGAVADEEVRRGAPERRQTQRPGAPRAA